MTPKKSYSGNLTLSSTTATNPTTINKQDEMNEGSAVRIIRMGLASVTFLLICLQGRQLSRLNFTTSLAIDNIAINGINRHDKILEETVKLLFMENTTAANDYLKDNELKNFKFYTQTLPPGVEDVDQLSECLENWGYNQERYAYPSKEQFLQTFCGWAKHQCNPTNHTRASQYSTARLNNNMDAVIAHLVTKYYGAFRTFNASEAAIKVVPFPYTTNYRCAMYQRGMKNDNTEILEEFQKNLMTENILFLMNDKSKLYAEKSPSNRPGHLVIPYANTNKEYQPNSYIFRMNQADLDNFLSNKKYALSAVFAEKISGNGYARKEFVAKADWFFGNGTLEHNNGTLGGMPVDITIIREKRKMVGEASTMQLYRDSIFCPAFRGDTPNQKRIFDAMMSLCIPVVMAHYWKDKEGFMDSSHFAPGVSVSKTYPFIKGSFEKYPDMGIDYSKLVLEINEKECYNATGILDCLPLILKKWLKDPVALREKQYSLAKYARVFSFGMEDNAFQYVDAMSALLVRARHFSMYEDTP